MLTMPKVNAASTSLAEPVDRRFQLAGAGVVLLAAPWLLLASRYAVIGFLLLSALWVARAVRRPLVTAVSPVEWPVVGLLGMAVISLGVSTDLSLSLPKLAGLLLGLTAFVVVGEGVGTPRDVARLVAGLSVGGVGVALVGLVGTAWLVPKVGFLAPIYSHLPHLIQRVATSQGVTPGFQPNEVAGILALLIPVPVAVAIYPLRPPYRLALLASAILMALTLLLTFSRSAILGVSAAMLLVAVGRWPRLAYGLPVGLVAGAGLIWRLGSGAVGSALFGLPTGADLPAKALSRGEIWQRALAMIQAFPFTGIGLNTFPIVLARLFPTFVNAPDQPIPHAHNLILQTALDLGLPGLLCFLTLLGAAGLALVRAWPETTGWRRGAVAGVAAGLIAHLVFSLTDAVTLGAKPGGFLWVVLGGALALGWLSSKRPALTVQTGRGSIARYLSAALVLTASSLGSWIVLWQPRMIL
jgi:putative inorganic carbon (HCO3(-)) transporter